MRLRFPKSARLYHASEFQRMRAEGASFHGKFMLLNVLARPEADRARVGIITSRRVGGAVERNRVRRRIREIVRAEMSAVEPGVWMVIVARQRAVGAAFDELRDEWRRLMRRANVLPPAS